MKSVAANAFLAEVARQGESLGETRLGAVEGGVEAGDLRDLRRSFHDRAHGGEVVGLMQWREWLQLGELGEHSFGHPHRSAVLDAPMDNPVAEGDDRPAL